MRASTEDRPSCVVATALLAIACTALAGCGDRGPRRHRVSGSVTFAGAPVEAGRIVFEPDASQGNSGPQGFAVIENGRFDTAAHRCKGIVGGPMIVIIDGMKFLGGEDATTALRPLFPTHEERIDLPKADTTRDFDVPKSGKP